MVDVNVRVNVPATWRVSTGSSAKIEQGFAVYNDGELTVTDTSTGEAHMGVAANSANVGEVIKVGRSGSVIQLANGLTVGQTVVAGEALLLLPANNWGKFTAGSAISAFALLAGSAVVDGGDALLVGVLTDPAIAGSLGGGFLPLTGGTLTGELIVSDARITITDPGVAALVIESLGASNANFTLTNTFGGGQTYVFRNKGSDGFFVILNVTTGVEPFQIHPLAPADSFFVDDIGQVGLGTDTPAAPLDVNGEGRMEYLRVKEQLAEPPAIAGEGAIWLEDNGILYMKDADDIRHALHLDAQAQIHLHSQSDASVAIANAEELTQIDIFDALSFEDQFGHVVGNISTGEIEIELGGSYLLPWSASFHAAGGSSKTFLIGTMAERPSGGIPIIAASNTSPIVIEIPFDNPESENGDVIRIIGGTGNTAVNGDWFTTPLTLSTFELSTLAGTASVGNGTYTGGAEISHFMRGSAVAIQTVSATDLGHVSGQGRIGVALVGDRISLWAANLDGSEDLLFRQATVGAMAFRA